MDHVASHPRIRPASMRLITAAGTVGLAAAVLAAPASATPHLGEQAVWGCVYDTAGVYTFTDQETGATASSASVPFVLQDAAADPEAHTAEDVTVAVRPAGSDAADAVQIPFAGGDPVGAFETRDIVAALGPDVRQAVVEVRVDGVTEAATVLEVETGTNAADQACFAYEYGTEVMGPQVERIDVPLHQPADLGRPADGSFAFGVSSTPAAVEVTVEGETHSLPVAGVWQEGSFFGVDEPVAALKEVDGGYGYKEWMSEALARFDGTDYALVYGEDADGVTRSRLALLHPYVDRAVEDAAAPAEGGHTVPSKVQTGDEAAWWLAGVSALGAGALVAARRRLGLAA